MTIFIMAYFMKKENRFMNAQKALIADIFNNSTLIEVPFFQRTYVWKEELWERFLEDMKYVVKTDKAHFLGSIILKEGEKPEAGACFSSRRTVVDGQQRLTTYLIFMKVLCLKRNQSVFDYQFKLNGKEIALKHGRNDYKAFEKVMSVEKAEKLDNLEPCSRIIEAYNYFIDKIDENELNERIILNNIQFVRIDLNIDEDEQQIFDTINSLGVSLTTSELLKNYFFSKKNITEYDNKWVSVFENDDETKKYWNTEIEAGRIKRALIDIFFDSYFQLFVQNKKYNIAVEDKIMYARVDKLAQSYHHFINNYCKGDKNEILSPLKEYANCFRKTFRPEICNMHLPKTFGIERINIIIFGLKTSTLIPYILFVANNVMDENERNRIYGILESYIMRRMTVHATTKNYNNLFTSLVLNKVITADVLIQRLTKESDISTYYPDDCELSLGFNNSKLVNLQSKGIIYLLESGIRPNNSSTVLLGFNNYSLEHLMPKKWRNNWKSCENEEEGKKRDSILLTLGNLAIIPQQLNASIRDENWQRKKEGKGNKLGLEACAKGLVTINDVLNKDDWNEESIKERADWLGNEARKLWKI